MRGILWASFVVVVACRPTSSLTQLASLGTDKGVALGGLGDRLAQALKHEYRGQLDHSPPPVSLVPSDGSELAMQALDAKVTIQGPLAYTELKFKFHNTEPRVREGRFSIGLPAGAGVARFAMLVNGAWREARVVSRMQGRVVYETFLHQRVDPALLEQDLGNQFSARVFPIPANADKEIIIGYEELVSETTPYTLALQGLPAIPKLAIAIDHDGKSSTVEHDGMAPTDVVVPISGSLNAVAAGHAFVVRIDPARGTQSPAPLDRVMFLVDTSASRATMMGKQADFLRRLVAALPPDATVAIAAFDHDVTELYRDVAIGAEPAIEKLLEHGALGASDLGAALDRASLSGMTRVVVIGDGVPTLGETDAKKLAARVSGSIERLDVVQIGQSIDRDTLKPVVRAGKQPGAILTGTDPTRVLHQLMSSLPPELPIRVDHATNVWPETTRDVAPGEPIWVTGIRPSPGPLAVYVGERKVDLSPGAADPVRTRRAVARAELVELTELWQAAPEPVAKEKLRKQIESVALENNLVSSQTSLLVLETDADEARTLGPTRGLEDWSDEIDVITGGYNAEFGRSTGGVVSRSSHGSGGETIRIRSNAPIIDQGSTRTGMTVDRDYIRNIPVPGRTFESVLAAAGSQNDGLGVSISGATSLENVYIVDYVVTPTVDTTSQTSTSLRSSRVVTETCGTIGTSAMEGLMSPLAQDYIRARLLRFPQDVGCSSESTPTPTPEITQAPPPKPAPPVLPYTGKLLDVMQAIKKGDRDRGLEIAAKSQLVSPGDLASIIALGEALEARGATTLAARAYASIIDLYPNRAELVRAAGERLDRVGARALAIDAYRRVLRDRPEQASTHRLLAYSLLGDGHADEALEVILAGRKYATGRGVGDIFMQDARVIAASLVAKDPKRRAELARKIGATIPTTRSMHVVLSWETDANDVDLHVRDGKGGHSFFEAMALPSGGKLLADLTDGFGPEMFVVDDPKAFPYTISAHYYRRGPMGVGIGTVQVIRHDGAGKVTVEDRPFVIQTDDATAELGDVR
jgi:hypothetical protein